ncbi:MAG: Na/Pi cotransporter family protein [Clostridia bacterium]|nr:Na/Pi cotransporter family protein [Clostridia bacterium]
MFDIFDVLALIGGLCLFLFGMSIMGDGLERRAGNSLKALLGKLTNSRIKGFLTGMGVTAVIQSSSATTVMVVGFVNSKVMTLRQSIGVIMGANIGTTVTAWLLSLGGISSDNVIVKLLKPTSFTPVLALIGIALTMFAKSSKKKDVGTILLGFATLMFGMDAMSDAVSGLANVPEFQNLFLAFTNPILGVLVGAFVTAVIQSSSASVGILQALSVTGAVSYAAAIPIIMGQNIGTCVTALLSSLGATKNAKRASIIHLLFNVLGTVVWLAVFCIISAIFKPLILNASASFLGIAICHSIFNILCTLLLLPAASLLEKLAYKLVPEAKEPEKVVELDERLLATPSIAVEQSYQLSCKMASEAVEGFLLSIRAIRDYSPEIAEKIRKIEDDTDRYEDVLGTYLTKLSKSQVSDEDSATVTKLLKAIGDFERISDHAVNVLESVEELREKGIRFSDAASAELDTLCCATEEILRLTETSFVKGDLATAYDVEPLEQVIDDIKKLLRDNHILRLRGGVCTVETGFIWSDLLTDFERVSDHCSNVAVGIIDESEHTMNAHEVIRNLKASDTHFTEKYAEYSSKYAVTNAQ